MLPKISVITPSFNQAMFLKETLESVLGQDYPFLEHIVIDGGSTDGSVEIIAAHAQHLAYWCSEPDGGQSAAVNKGVSIATGEIVVWLNSDDTFLPNALLTVGKTFEANPDWKALTGACLCVNKSGQPMDLQTGGELDVAELERATRRAPFPTGNECLVAWPRDWFPQASTFVSRELWNICSGVDRDLDYSMDYALWRRVCERVTIQVIPERLSTYRFHSAAKCAKNTWGPLGEVIEINRSSMTDVDFRGFSEWALPFLLTQLERAERKVAAYQVPKRRIMSRIVAKAKESIKNLANVTKG